MSYEIFLMTLQCVLYIVERSKVSALTEMLCLQQLRPGMAQIPEFLLMGSIPSLWFGCLALSSARRLWCCIPP